MNIQIYRTNSSSYQKTEFFYQEQAKLETLESVTYVKSVTGLDTDGNFILITNTHTNAKDIPAQILDRTLLMIHPNSGYDNFQKDFISRVNFPIILGNKIRASAVSEYILAAIFKELCNIPNHHHWSIDRSWERPLISRKKVLIIGHGHIGKILTKSLTPLAQDVTVFDPYSEGNEKNIHTNWNDELMNGVDIFITVPSLNEGNRNFFDLNKLKRLAPDSLIINASRGEIFNEEDLVAHASKHPKTNIYLDVFANEPFSPGYLHHLPNIRKSSHIAGVSSHLNDQIIDFEFETINDFISLYLNSKEQEFLNKYKDSILGNRLIEGMII